MQRILLTLLLTAATLGLGAQVVLEDFEGGVADLPWNAYEGFYAGPVMNPVDSTGNPSEWAGSYTKAGDKAFSFFVAELTEPLDLSTNNRFSIQIYAGAPTQLLLKLEQRGGGQAIEETVNIATANVWRTYTFDFSAAAGLDSLNNLILFFDPGVETSADTYLFDNIIASPAGDCAGVEEDETVLDDFECQRNVTYGVPGFDDLTVIENPDKSGINTSDSVGRYTDQEGGFHALVIDYNGFIDLTTNNYFCIKVWAPVVGDLLFKVQDGLRPAFEDRVAITETETWVEVCQDFSAQAGGQYKRLVLFFNAGRDGSGDIYYLDDLTITPTPPAEALEDFEAGADLAWMPLNNDNTLHGTFNGVIDNPDPNGDNTSDKVGSYTRGSSQFSTLTAVLPNGIDLTGNPQLNLDVWAPNGSTKVSLQLSSATEGAKSADATLDSTMSWQTLSFNFEEFEDIDDFGRVNILFDSETMGTGTYYFDNLIQGQATVDACAGVEPDPTVLDDFECQRNAEYTCCDVTVAAVNNPDVTPANTSTRVGEVNDPPGAFNALVIDNTTPYDLSLNNQLSAKIWAPVAGQILFKLEGEGVAPVEIFQDIPSTMEWNTYTVDLSPYEGMGFSKIVLFFGAGGDNTADNTYYLDDIALNRAPYVSSCVSTFDNVTFTVADWQYFANGAFSENGFIISDNPDTMGINKSARVGTFEEATDGEGFAGMFADLDAPVILPTGDKTITMKWLLPVAASVVVKLEGGLDGAPGSGDVAADYTTPGEWQELTFDFSGLADGAAYGRITLIPNIGVVPEMPLTHYFDDIAVGGGDCESVVGIFSPAPSIDRLRAFPNPVTSELTIDNSTRAATFTLTNLMGQRVRQFNAQGAGPRVQWNVSDLPRATYVLSAQDRSGRVVARSLIVKQ